MENKPITSGKPTRSARPERQRRPDLDFHRESWQERREVSRIYRAINVVEAARLTHPELFDERHTAERRARQEMYSRRGDWSELEEQNHV